ncbi:MAG: hypothetical protein GY783_11340 [Gammaproteobacteria bacterium]|nr:hypothetical protein [Gammaproteobacteria bacterium]
MKGLGYFLLTAGFLGGAFATSLDVRQVNWMIFAIAAAAAVIGLLLFKRQVSALARSDTVLEVNRGELRESIQNIVRDLEDLTGSAAQQGAQLRDKIDLKLRNDLRRFADARESMVHLFGLQTYADIMSSFAAGERYINRVWSSSADGYDEEASAYLEKAAAQFVEAQRQLTQAAQGST